MNSHVQSYYDRNTKRFLKYGHGGAEGVLHRAVWAPGVRSRAEALRYVNGHIAWRAAELGAKTVLDAGCGVGGTVAAVAEQGIPRVVGVTISTVQKERGTAFLERRLSTTKSAWSIHAGDFCDRDFMRSLRDEDGFDLIYFVESFIHAPCGEELLETVSELLAPLGRVIICDDFLTAPLPEQLRKPRVIREYVRGWHVDNLVTPAEVTERAHYAGLVLENREDLTPHLELGRPRDRAIRAVVPVLRLVPLPFAWRDNFIGGNAIQECLRRGLIGYYVLEFARGDG
ncbi:MAG: SAM-dependent methyltransferase [bacterium]